MNTTMQRDAIDDRITFHPDANRANARRVGLLATAVAMLLALGMPARDASAHAGDLDPAFGNGGVVIVPNLRAEAPFDQATSVAIQPDGRILVAGQWGASSPGPTFAILRFNADGSPDPTFGFEGTVSLSSGFAGGDEAHAIAIQPDGSIVVAGDFGSDGGLYRLQPNGDLDTTFGGTGAVVVAAGGTSTINALALDDSGGTLFAGTNDASGPRRNFLGWLALDGSTIVSSAVDLGFGDLDQTATSLVRQADGAVVVGGYADLSDQINWGRVYCAIARFTPTAFPSPAFVPDMTYGEDPPTTFFAISPGTGCYADTLALLPDGSTLAAGRETASSGWIGLYARLDTAGQYDVSFADTPVFTPWGDNSARRVVIQADGKPVLVGFTGVDDSGVPGPFAARLDTDGDIDADYGNGGVALVDFDPNDFASGQALGAAIDAEGRVVIAGIYYNGTSDAGGRDASQIFVARLLGDADDTIFADGFD
jgi:uncharacterized delta-60 repeat protein